MKRAHVGFFLFSAIGVVVLPVACGSSADSVFGKGGLTSAGGDDGTTEGANGSSTEASTGHGGASTNNSTATTGGASSSSTQSGAGATSSTATSTNGTTSTTAVASTGSGDPCAGVECASPPSPSACYLDGVCSNGTCSYPYAEGVDCDDGDSCTIGDACDFGNCAGTPLDCGSPQAPVCITATTLRTYTAGVCSAGQCSTPSTDTNCPNGCGNGACIAGGCAGPTLPLFIAGADPALTHACGSACNSDWCWCTNCVSQSGDGIAFAPGNYNVDFYAGPSGTVAYTFKVFDVTTQAEIASDTGTYSTFFHHDLVFTAPAGCHVLEFRLASTTPNVCNRNYGTTITAM